MYLKKYEKIYNLYIKNVLNDGKEAFDFRGYAIKVTIKYAFNLINAKDDVVENDNNVVENVVENGNNVIENDTTEQVFNEIKKYKY